MAVGPYSGNVFYADYGYGPGSNRRMDTPANKCFKPESNEFLVWGHNFVFSDQGEVKDGAFCTTSNSCQGPGPVPVIGTIVLNPLTITDRNFVKLMEEKDVKRFQLAF